MHPIVQDFIQFVEQEHGHHNAKFMTELDGEDCPIFKLLNSDYSDKELIKVALEVDDSILESWVSGEPELGYTLSEVEASLVP